MHVNLCHLPRPSEQLPSHHYQFRKKNIQIAWNMLKMNANVSYNYVDVTPKPESRLLLWELLQCCVSKETTMGDGPASNTELCYIPNWFRFILNRVWTNEIKQKVVKRGGRSVTDRGPLGNCNIRRPCSEACLLWFTCCAQLCTLVVEKNAQCHFSDFKISM